MFLIFILGEFKVYWGTLNVLEIEYAPKMKEDRQFRSWLKCQSFVFANLQYRYASISSYSSWLSY